METVGIVGLGSMGLMAAKALVRNGTEASRLCLFTRTPARCEGFLHEHPGVRSVPTLEELGRECQLIVLCVPPKEVQGVLLGLQGTQNGQHVVSFAASVTLDCLGSLWGDRVSRIIPNITAEADEGAFLVCHGPRLPKAQAAALETLLSPFATLYPIPEDQIEIYTDLASCSPGIFSAVFQEFLGAAQRSGPIDADLAARLFAQTLSGLTRLYRDQGMGLEETITRVARRGGVTEVGIAVVREKLPKVFDEVFEKTLENHRSKKRAILESYGSPLRSRFTD